MTQTPQAFQHTLVYRRLILPILGLLRMGASPRKLAWSIALGLVIGVNPLLGSTTLLCLAAAAALRLNLAASQLANHLMYPVELLLLMPFLQLGAWVFRTGPLPLSPKSLAAEVRTHPVQLIRSLWIFEWHALVLWAGLAVLLIPVTALVLTPVLRRLLARVERHEYPLVPSL